MPIRVSIVEDDRITRDSLATIVRRDPDLTFVAAYPDGEAALHELPGNAPDVAVIDVNLAPSGSGRLDGADCLAALRARCPDLRALMLTVYDDHERIFKSLRAGAAGYVLKRATPTRIVAAIKEIHAGGAPLSVEVARQVVDSFHGPVIPPAVLAKLTRREVEILAHLAKGATAKEIAQATGVTAGTVRVHLHAIYHKLGVENRLQAINVYLGRG
jgi:DNA-binding NarL/FixJ family response regulator